MVVIIWLFRNGVRSTYTWSCGYSTVSRSPDVTTRMHNGVRPVFVNCTSKNGRGGERRKFAIVKVFRRGNDPNGHSSFCVQHDYPFLTVCSIEFRTWVLHIGTRLSSSPTDLFFIAFFLRSGQVETVSWCLKGRDVADWLTGCRLASFG